MNYRHAFHAGNFADVFKHAVLALCLKHLAQKPAPFRVIDTHAGAGRYDLAGVEAGKTLEWIEGIGRLLGVDAAPVGPDAANLLAPYLDTVRAANPQGALSLYPGSPLIARALMREADRLVVNELHPEDNQTLGALFRRDAQVKVMAMDGWTAVRALLPPKERRGLVLIDPPFEAPGEFGRIAAALADAHRRFVNGMAFVWYPVKEKAAVETLFAAIEPIGLKKTLRAELFIRRPDDPAKFNASGLFIVNPPWTLQRHLETLGPFLAERLAQGPGAGFRMDCRGL